MYHNTKVTIHESYPTCPFALVGFCRVGFQILDNETDSDLKQGPLENVRAKFDPLTSTD